VRLRKLYPGFNRSCAVCQQFMHEDGRGVMGEIATRGGKPIPRVPGTKTPCAICPKIPPGAEPRPENAADLTGRPAAAYQHYLECKAVGDFPNDPIVRHTAVLIRQAEESCERADARRLALTVIGNAFRGGPNG
jgi:hypothetical protein